MLLNYDPFGRFVGAAQRQETEICCKLSSTLFAKDVCSSGFEQVGFRLFSWGLLDSWDASLQDLLVRQLRPSTFIVQWFSTVGVGVTFDAYPPRLGQFLLRCVFGPFSNALRCSPVICLVLFSPLSVQQDCNQD